YNHFGPAGNYLPSYDAAYISKTRRNDWGDAPDFALPILRRAIVENVRYWLDEFRFDGLRLDATHAIDDSSSPHLLWLIADAAPKESGGRRLLFAEDNRNDAALVTSEGLDAIWADDFHNQLHVCLTGEQEGYYRGYRRELGDLARVINRGWLYEGQTYPPTGAARGTKSDALSAPAFVYCLQNHDQIGNRAFGERLSSLVSPDEYRAAVTLLLFLPMTPLLFMGQEWAASSPFLFFTDHDEELGRLVREGRREEFKAFGVFADSAARERIPDPQAIETFASSRLRWDERTRGEHARVLELHRALLALRASDPVLRDADRRALSAEIVGDVLVVRRTSSAGRRVLLVSFGETETELSRLPLMIEAPKVLLRSDGPTEASALTLPGHTAFVLSD
ncbi:MAG TPA: DUF3459 domain-containing protein, partial [Polyangia bacterium]|nr:DUF3459 domain-containing protein [Polyangia bacterium]